MRNRSITLPINIHDNFDHVAIEAPQIPQVKKLVVFPLKVVYINIFADPDATIAKYFTDLEDFAEFCESVYLSPD